MRKRKYDKCNSCWIIIFSFYFTFYIHAWNFTIKLPLAIFYASGEKYLSFLGVAPKTGKNYTKSVAAVAVVLVGPMRTQQKMSENDDVASYFFLHETCENKKFLSILEKGKQTREICRYSILNSEPGACNSWWVCNWVHFLCVILTSNLSLHSLCWLLSYKEKWEVRWQEMQPLKLTFHSCFCHKRTKTLWDITP